MVGKHEKVALRIARDASQLSPSSAIGSESSTLLQESASECENLSTMLATSADILANSGILSAFQDLVKFHVQILSHYGVQRDS